jgi:hypothetical protein
MNKLKSIFCILPFLLIMISLLSFDALAQTKLELFGIPINVVSETKQAFRIQYKNTEFFPMRLNVVIVIPNDYYSRENIEKFWQHFKQKYADKKETLDLKIYTSSTYEFNRQQFGDESWGGVEQFIYREPSPRLYEARFERLNIEHTSGEAQELLSYIPDLTKPEKRTVVVLAGRNSQ